MRRVEQKIIFAIFVKWSSRWRSFAVRTTAVDFERRAACRGASTACMRPVFLYLKTDRRFRPSRLSGATSKDLLTVLVLKAKVTLLCHKDAGFGGIYWMANSCTIGLGNAPDGTDNFNVTIGAIFN
jgi:hypothetical protein